MKIFVTVGTTAFDSLVEQVDLSLSSKFEVVSQIANGEYQPSRHSFFRFSGKIEEYYDWADIIVTHGGAGSIFNLLEAGKKILIVPNTQRLDHHQQEIAHYMRENNHALTCVRLECLVDDLYNAIYHDCKPYEPPPFSGVCELRKMLGLDCDAE